MNLDVCHLSMDAKQSGDTKNPNICRRLFQGLTSQVPKKFHAQPSMKEKSTAEAKTTLGLGLPCWEPTSANNLSWNNLWALSMITRCDGLRSQPYQQKGTKKTGRLFGGESLALAAFLKVWGSNAKMHVACYGGEKWLVFLGTKCDKTQRTSHSACGSAAWPQKWEGKTLTAPQWKLHHHVEGWMLRLPSSPKHLRAAPKHWTWSIKPNRQFPSRRCSLLPVLHR